MDQKKKSNVELPLGDKVIILEKVGLGISERKFVV